MQLYSFLLALFHAKNVSAYVSKNGSFEIVPLDS